MKVGITGNRHGMTFRQQSALRQLFNHFMETDTISEFHHGDCVGVDIEGATIAEEFGIPTIAHPPTNESQRAFHVSSVILDSYDYLVRNRHIVDAVDIMIAFPDGPERLRSGTWSTIRYTKKTRKPLFVCDPKGQRIR